MHIAILVANTDDSAFAQARPKDDEKFVSLLHAARPDWQISAFSVKDDVFPPDPAVFDGFIITGSPASVNDPAAWVGRLMDLIRQIEGLQIPLFGACFGHQAVAKALGGQVGSNPGGWVFGLTTTETHAPAPWQQGDLGPIRLYAAHSEQVTALPQGAQVLGGNAACPVGSMAIGNHIFTTQYHPEMTPDFVADLIAEYADQLPAPVVAEARAGQAQAAETDRVLRWIVAFFESHQDRAASRSIAVT